MIASPIASRPSAGGLRPVARDLTCNVCDTTMSLALCETARVSSNVRRFRHEPFRYARCPFCRSIHAVDAVDLPHYYRDYPLLAPCEERLQSGYADLCNRLAENGLDRDHRVLDYGCGGGGFVHFLRGRGYAQAAGYDPHATEFADCACLSRRYDCVFSQDVLEHAADPFDLLARFGQLARPGGLVMIGTPDAGAIDLQRPDAFRHMLHAPYHRHILAKEALLRAAGRLDWELLRYYPRQYGSSLRPTQNVAFGLHYLRCFDDCLDMVCEPLRFDSWRLWTPKTLYLALLGHLHDPRVDVGFAFRTPAPRNGAVRLAPRSETQPDERYR